MKAFRTAALQSGFVALAFAQVDTVGFEPGFPGGIVQTQGSDAFQYWNETRGEPNYTKSVEFTLNGQEGWIWRLNVTDMAAGEIDAPLHTLPHGSNSSGARIAVTSWDLQWPNSSATIEEAVDAMREDDDDDEALCVYWLNYVFLSNVTNRWQNDDDNCEDVVGSDCLNAIFDAMDEGGRVTFQDEYICQNVPMDYTQLDECQDVFNGDFNTSFIPFSSYYNATTRTNNTDDEEYFYQNGEPFAMSWGRASLPNDTSSALREARSKLNMMIFSGPGEDHTALCTRMDPEIDDWDANWRANESCLIDVETNDLVECDKEVTEADVSLASTLSGGRTVLTISLTAVFAFAFGLL